MCMLLTTFTRIVCLDDVVDRIDANNGGKANRCENFPLQNRFAGITMHMTTFAPFSTAENFT